MVFAVATLADGFASLSLEVDAGGVEEDQLEFGEQIARVGEQPLLDQVLGTSRGESGSSGAFRGTTPEAAAIGRVR